MSGPTYQDATLMLQLAQWNATLGVQEASNWLWSDEFVPDYAGFKERYPHGSEGQLKAHKVCGFFETLGTLYKYGLFNRDLLFDWLAVSLVWKRVKSFVHGIRQDAGEPRLYENFEAMARADAAWAAKRLARAKGKKAGTKRKRR